MFEPVLSSIKKYSERFLYGFSSSAGVMIVYVLYFLLSFIDPISHPIDIHSQTFLFTWSMVFAAKDYVVVLLVSSILVTTLALLISQKKAHYRRIGQMLFTNIIIGIPLGILSFVIVTSGILLISLIGGAIIEIVITKFLDLL